ncbi:hypothetical protein [Bosea sp. NBC_00550]|uniref:hypothetical protein n=1 Tax=Bosea sp. NBC_00550 TaxID=2969621 RepID=UPI0022307B82|nr:hypothetical protein [Bosea sp. NBC_00550]UZF92092.1 hypothetical protein NWE53_23900 [Bosea sp. NBC_00550]
MRAAMVALTCLLSFPAGAAGPFGKIVVGNWSGGTFTNDQTGAFSHCAVSAHYKSGVTMLTSVTSQFSWLLGFSKPEWKLRTGETLSLRLVFDRSSTIDVTANIKSPTLVTIAMPAQSALINAFRQGRYLELVANDARFTFALTSTGEMLPALVECVKQSANVRGPTAPGAPNQAQPREATEAERTARAEKKALLEKTRDLIRSKMLACIGREGAPMLLTDEKAEVVAKAAMLFCKSDVDALTNATIELIETEEGRPANRGAIRDAAERRVQEVVTAHVIRTRGEMIGKGQQRPDNPPPARPSDPASRPSQML